MNPWRRKSSHRIHSCRIFDLDELRLEPGDGRPDQTFWVIDAPHWINVIPLTDDDQVLLLRQHRVGIDETTLEIPGGMCDPGESPRVSAHRELLEETGYESRDLVELGYTHPNPAIQNNRCYTYLARDLLRVGEPRPDANEAFEQVRHPLSEIPGLIAGQQITHALVVAAFQLFAASAAAKLTGQDPV